MKTKCCALAAVVLAAAMWLCHAGQASSADLARAEALVAEARQALHDAIGERESIPSPGLVPIPSSAQSKADDRLTYLRRELLRIGPAALGPLLKVVDRRDRNQRRWQEDTILSMGSAAIPALAAALKDADGEVRGQAAECLRRMPDPASKRALLAELTDPESAFRKDRMSALPGPLADDPRMAAVLITSLERQAGIASAAKTTTDEEAGRLLVEMLKECTAREKKLRVDLDQALAAQAQLIQEIGQIGAPVIHKVAQQLGEPVTSDVGDALESADDRLSGAALRALPRMGHAGAYTLAGRLEDPDPRTRERALSALATTTVPEPWYGEMLKLLADPDAEVRAAVTRLLPRMKPDKVIAPALDRLTALSEKNDDASRRTRSELVRALGQLGDARAVPPLMAILTDRKEPIGLREVAAQSLVWLGASDLEKTLMEIVSDPDQAGVLGECRPEDLQMVVPDPVPLYVTALTRATDPQVIGSMTWKLGYLRDRRAVRPLIEVMNKYWGDNRTYYEGLSAQAALNLGEIGDPAAVPALLQLVARERWTQKSFPERHVLALGRIGDQRARALLLRLLRESQPGTWRERALAVALGDLGEPAAIPALKEWLKCGSHGDGPPPLCPGYNFTEDAAQALARIGAPAVPVLLEALDWRYEHTADYAALALGEIGDRQAVEPLRRLLSHPSDRTRHHAAIALGMVGDRAALLDLRRLADDSSGYVRVGAVEGLWQLGDRTRLSVVVEVLKNGDEDWEREEAAAALGRMKEPTAIAPLREALQDRAFPVRWAAKKALAKVR